MATEQEVWQAFSEIIDVMGGEATAKAMAQAMSTDALEDTLAYIARCEDIELSVEIKEH